ncbi:heptosyltransferase family protein [Acidobacterium capsulatum ATCC 51196]|uniref:Heptosyltransferase family protein n=2 Tax=Acidobacteriaceae TaxID=204434 RepID=C1F803_ACIC5|nr:heptosyltransferase family protein [Acidobacterium capsulatum ATCC 51196]
MGDLLNAAPVISEQLRCGHSVKLLLFPGMMLEEFVSLLDFGPEVANLELISLPVSGGIRSLGRFLRIASKIPADLVWISPHGPREASSWKIPLLLWLTKIALWRNGKIAAADSEHLSWLFDIRVPIDRDLPLYEREWRAFMMMEADGKLDVPLPRVKFLPKIDSEKTKPRMYDVLIHPGANASNRTWPYEHYSALVQSLPPELTIAVLGLPQDLQRMRSVLPDNRGIIFLSGSLEEAIIAIARARVVLAMDSGTAHFAQNLGISTVALFGKSAPDTIIGRNSSVLPIYERRFSCQPCGRATCSQPEVYCMNSISAETVVAAVKSLLSKS